MQDFVTVEHFRNEMAHFGRRGNEKAPFPVSKNDKVGTRGKTLKEQCARRVSSNFGPCPLSLR